MLFGSLGWLAGLSLLGLWRVMNVSPTLETALLAWGLNSRTWLVFIAYATVINPWLEEIYWRNWLGSTNTRPVITDAVFAGFHILILAPFFQPVWLGLAFTVLATSAWIWRQVNRRENSMLASTLFHMSADVSILLAIWSVLGS
jgi:signal transduction histidine kinase